MAAAALDGVEPPSSRRVAASAVHANGAAAGAPSPAAPVSHDNNPEPRSPTVPAAAGDAVIAGAAAAAAAAGAAAPAETTDTADTAAAGAATAAAAGDSFLIVSAGVEATGASTRALLGVTGSLGGVTTAAGLSLPAGTALSPRWRPEDGAGESGAAALGAAPTASVEPPRDDVTATDVSGTSVTAGTSAGVETDSDAVEFAPPRAPVCDPRAGPAVDDVSEESDGEDVPVEPSEPCRSAYAIGIDATAAPTPNATANAPTRPT